MLIIDLERLERLIPDAAPEVTRSIADSQHVANLLLENVRKIIWDLRPSILDDLGLFSAIRWYARNNLEKAGVSVDFSAASDLTRLPSHLETILFRVAQEAISNILRHADAKHVSIRLWRDAEQIWLVIQDDGHGFDIEKATGSAVDRKQLGLLGIQERASLVHGEVIIHSARESGTCLQVHIPIHEGNQLGPEQSHPGLTDER
jgi:signal transduction histidine kinase